MRRPTNLGDKKVKPNFKFAWKNLISYIKPYLLPMIVALTLTIVSTVGMILSPKLLENIGTEIVLAINPISPTFGIFAYDKVITIMVQLIAIVLVANVFIYIQSIILAKITQLTSVRLRNDISTKINDLPLKYFDQTTHGDVMSKITNDVDTINQALNNSISTFISATIMFVGTLILMFITNWIMAITTILSAFIGFFLMAMIMKRSQKYFIGQQKSLGLINGHIEEVYSGHHIVKISNADESMTEDFKKLNNDLNNNIWKSQFFGGLMHPLMTFISNFAYVTTAIVGIYLAVTNRLSDVVIIATFIFYVRFFTNSLVQFGQVGTNIQSTTAASERVFKLLDEPEMNDESHLVSRLENVKGHVKFENVRFGYDEDKVIINDFTAEVKAGSMVAIVGPTGAGKTTMVNLLMRFYELNEGKIFIDGIDTATIKRSNVREVFSMVLQDTWIFEDTIANNIIYNKENVTEEELVNAAKAVGLDHFIRTLPNGYNAVLDDKLTLSEGQKQLLTIARAMIKNSPMLILDEATSSVDTRTEKLIQEAMEKLAKGRTSFVIAHRLSTIVNADLILVMDKGDIVEQGTHEELIANNGFYANLYLSQFEE